MTWALLVVCTTLNISCVWAGQICVAGPPGDQIATAHNLPSATSRTPPGSVGPACWCPFDEVSQGNRHGVRLWNGLVPHGAIFMDLAQRKSVSNCLRATAIKTAVSSLFPSPGSWRRTAQETGSTYESAPLRVNEPSRGWMQCEVHGFGCRST